jgi:hypothetical protein
MTRIAGFLDFATQSGILTTTKKHNVSGIVSASFLR